MDAQAQIQALREQFVVEMQRSALRIDDLSLRLDSALSTIEALGDSTGIGQFYYVYLRLESQVQAIVLPQLRAAKETQAWDYHIIH